MAHVVLPPATAGAARATSLGATATFDHEAWGVGGDLLWIALSIGTFWMVLAMFWR